MKTKKNKCKWSRIYGDAKIGFWNPWSYCNKRHEYAKSLKYDILGLAELHNNQTNDNYKGRNWICSERSAVDEQGYDADPAAGVAILLSPRFAERILDSGWEGSRIVWARLAGPVCNLFVVVTYIPHRGRTKKPFTTDTIKKIKELLVTHSKENGLCHLNGGPKLRTAKAPKRMYRKVVHEHEERQWAW